MKRICYLTDSLSWIQAQRAKDLQPYLPEHELVPMLPTHLSAPLPFDAFWLASWRILLAHPEMADWLPWYFTMASVTSHYNLGGGLKPEICFRKGSDPALEFSKAITTLKRFRLVTCNSRILYDLLSSHLPEIVLAPNGVDAEFFHPIPYVQRSYGPPTVSWVGKDKGAKNIAAFMDALRGLDGRSALFQAIIPKKRGGPVKTRDGMRSFYWHTDFLACTSWAEGTPNPAIEAMACGVPVIGTHVGNLPELIAEGDTGWCIEPTADSLIACIERLQHLEPHEYRRMSHNIRAEVENHWTWKIRAEAYRKALETLCG